MPIGPTEDGTTVGASITPASPLRQVSLEGCLQQVWSDGDDGGELKLLWPTLGLRPRRPTVTGSAEEEDSGVAWFHVGIRSSELTGNIVLEVAGAKQVRRLEVVHLWFIGRSHTGW
ncbi:unnamed protein product [Lactuca virosa]|uniref:Uncharacterized protein n=1 Tax=Lactuca virosa TaxID=75947 RepID=A0AAU9LU86_9ASTR|nr:unnamed protein product [Lactuca virosa]